MNDVTKHLTAAAFGAATGASRASQADFDRPPVCILGLPFDAVTIAQAVQRIRDDAFAGRRCFVSTPNLNFAIAARRDPRFRGSILRSNLSLVDGMPLIWLGRLIGLTLPERVSGADVFNALLAHPGPPMTAYIFGGNEDAARSACEQINRRNGGIRCVGFEFPGFVTIESMSTDAQIDRINASGAQFVFVSLGAQKGQAWIEHNAGRLKAPVLSHLGAVVNFAAGTVSRAPGWVQRSGFEWLWRIKEEPALWRRYLRDGAIGLALLLTRVLPDALAFALGAKPGRPRSARFELRKSADAGVLHLQGRWDDRADFQGLSAALARFGSGRRPLQVDLSAVDLLGNGLTGLLLRASGRFGSQGGFSIVAINPIVRVALRRKMADHLLLPSVGALPVGGDGD